MTIILLKLFGNQKVDRANLGIVSSCCVIISYDLMSYKIMSIINIRISNLLIFLIRINNYKSI